jgi:hypothetical protein
MTTFRLTSYIVLNHRNVAGITHAPAFSRSTTHLLCPCGTGPKHTRARAWGTPVVDMQWLAHIARTGALPSPGMFLVSNSLLPDANTRQTITCMFCASHGLQNTDPIAKLQRCPTWRRRRGRQRHLHTRHHCKLHSQIQTVTPRTKSCPSVGLVYSPIEMKSSRVPHRHFPPLRVLRAHDYTRSRSLRIRASTYPIIPRDRYPRRVVIRKTMMRRHHPYHRPTPRLR